MKNGKLQIYNLIKFSYVNSISYVTIYSMIWTDHIYRSEHIYSNHNDHIHSMIGMIRQF